MKFVVGLGNPDGKYTKTYHNIGFVFADCLAKKINADFTKKKCKAEIAEGLFNGEKIMIFKPTTYMNLSGECVVEIIKKYKAKVEDILIAYDDIDLDVGKFRFRENGSAGTHNGMRSIVSLTGKNDIKRIRIGIGRDEKMDLADYVLSRIDPAKKEEIDKAISESIDFVLEKVFQ